MYFKLSYSINNFWLYKDEELFILDNGRMHVRLYKPSIDDLKNGMRKEIAFCDLIYEITPSKKSLEICDKILNRQDLGIVTDDKRGITYNTDNYFIPHLDSFPEYFKEFYSQLKMTMDNSIKAFISNVMWVCNHNGNHSPSSRRDFEFSRDKKVWVDMPIDLRVSGSIGDYPIMFNQKGHDIISSRMEAPPIHHSLFLEAWGQRKINKRSSLIMGLAALESSVKYMFVKNVPDAVWMVENSPSPPVQKMITEMIKTLPIKNKIDGRVRGLSKEILEELKNWISVRNTLIHKGTVFPKTFDIGRILFTIKSIIYLMDYYGGEDWTIVYVDKRILD